MPKLNENYLQLKDSYLFSEIAHRTAAYSEKHPDKPVIRLGICCDHDQADFSGTADIQTGAGGTA